MDLDLATESGGTISILRLLDATHGNVSQELFDSGVTRKKAGEYEWNERGREVVIMPRKSGRGQAPSLTMPKELKLTPSLIAFVGLYAGDGNKGSYGSGAGQSAIGFSQQYLSVQRLAQDRFAEIFGSQFETAWGVLDDNKWYEGDDFAPTLASIEKELMKAGQALPSTTEKKQFRRRNQPFELPARKVALIQEFVKRRFIEQSRHFGLNVDARRLTVTISPAKGGHEVIQNLVGSNHFMPIWLKIVNAVVDTILDNRQSEALGWLHWDAKPQELLFGMLDVESYLSNRVSYIRGSKTLQYTTTPHSENLLQIKRTGSALVNRRIPLTPLEFLYAGLYLAEGATNKDDIFVLGETEVHDVSVAFTSSENRLITNFFVFLDRLGPDLIRSWRVKVGKKYLPQTIMVAQRLGTLPLLGGAKGEGIVRTWELRDAFLDWALRSNPSMKKHSTKYHHLESTGVGIPRLDVNDINKTASTFVIALIRDLTFFPSRLGPFVRKADPK